MIRVVLVDDQPLVRDGLRALLERSDDLRVVGEANDGDTGYHSVVSQRPDVVLMDIRMPRVDGLQATRRIRQDDRLHEVRVLLLTTFDDDELLFEGIRSGASGYLLKDASPDELRRAVRLAAAGEAVLAPAVTRRVMDAASRAAVRSDPRLDALTQREREVLHEVGRGLSNDAIGERLHISADTARTHVNRILTKLHARNRAQLVVIAYETGLVVPGEDWM